MGYIYKITNDVNNKIYIGLTTTSLEKRFKQHLKNAKYYNTKYWNKYNMGKSHLYSAIQQIGSNHFKIEEIEQCNTLDELKRQEDYWIITLNTTNNKIGYNINRGGICPNFGRKPSKETLIKYSLAQKKRYSNMSEEKREKLLKNISLGHKNFWKNISNERKQQEYKKLEYMRSRRDWNKLKQSVSNAKSKTVFCIELDETFKNSFEAAKRIIQFKPELKIENCSSTIRKAAIGIRKSAYGYHWKQIN